MRTFVITALLYLRAAVTTAAAEDNLEVSGGGIVVPGSNLVLKYKVASGWDRCFWFRTYNGTEENCSYDNDDKLEGKGQVHRCSSPDLKTSWKYTGSTATECTITLEKVTKATGSGVWSARLDSEKDTKDIKVIVAIPIQSVEVGIGEGGKGYLVAGSEGLISCYVIGGNPEARINMTIPGIEKIKDQTGRKEDGKGGYNTTLNVTVNARVVDNGKNVTCRAGQWDRMGKPLFDMKTGPIVRLNVTFPPQPLGNQVIQVHSGEDAKATFIFAINPKPSEALRWFSIDSNGTRKDIEEGGGEKYVISETANYENDTSKFKAELMIKKAMKEDAAFNYTLNVTNNFGYQLYNFSLTILPEESSSTTSSSSTSSSTTTSPTASPSPSPSPSPPEGNVTTTPKPGGGGEGGSGMGVVAYIIISIVVLVAIVLLGGFLYKRQSERVDSAPLSTLERQHNR